MQYLNDLSFLPAHLIPELGDVTATVRPAPPQVSNTANAATADDCAAEEEKQKMHDESHDGTNSMEVDHNAMETSD